jgi:hypothetical protein
MDTTCGLKASGAGMYTSQLRKLTTNLAVGFVFGTRFFGIRRNPCDDRNMKHIINLPEDIEQRLAEKAAESGEDLVRLIHIAVVRFVEDEIPAPVDTEWSDETDRRRRMLIDKEIAGTITGNEQRELVRLDRMANEHFDRIAPPPISGAQKLYDKLLQNRGDRD